MEDKAFENKISELRDKLNRMELIDEVGKTDVEETAIDVLSERFYSVLNRTGGYMDYPVHELMRCAANSVLEELDLEPVLTGETQADVLLEYLKRF
jgi:hypothetical protein